MSPPTGLEGELRVNLLRRLGRCCAVHIESSRPDVAKSLLQGRRAAEVLAAVPLLFSVCARSQAAACRLALAAAGYGDAGPALDTARAALHDELLRESACQVLLQWPRWIGEQPGAQALTAARTANQGLAAAGDATTPARTQLEEALFGMSAADWLALGDATALDRWVDAGRSPAARTLRHLGAPPPDSRPALPPLLPTVLLPPQLAELGQALQRDAGFARRPVFDGVPAETGALSRWQLDARVAAWLRRDPSRLSARLLARLHETAALLAGHWQPGFGMLTPQPDQGLAWVDNARGLLVHQVRLESDAKTAGGARAADYRIMAPTEWNFHPAGALTQGLLHSPAADTDAAHARAMRLIHSLDPCVTCRVELRDA